MQRYKAEIEYKGTKYSGMQKQDGIMTVQGVIESALHRFTGGKHEMIDYCGRTDAGVHAFAQVIHFDINLDLASKLSDTNILKGINFFLNKNLEDVALKNITKVPQEFHSRFSCTGREYKYYIYNAEIRSPIFDGNLHHVPTKLDVALMQDSANILVGTHDFSSFRGRGCQAQSPIKTVEFIKITHLPHDVVEIHISAKSFLYRMVRNITGALIYVGIGKFGVSDMLAILEKRDVSVLPYTAPACGLYFFKANYD